MSARKCQYCEGPMPPSGRRGRSSTYCSRLCSCRGASQRWYKKKREARLAQGIPCLDCGQAIETLNEQWRQPIYCAKCATARAKQGRKRRKTSLIKAYCNPATPLPRFLRRIIEALREGPKPTVELAKTLGVSHCWMSHALQMLTKRGEVVAITFSGNNRRVVCLSKDATDIQKALEAVLTAERAYLEAWEKVVSARDTFERISRQAPSTINLAARSRMKKVA